MSIATEKIFYMVSKFELLDLVPIGECLIDKDYNVLFWNTALENWTGISRTKILGNSIFNFFPDLTNENYKQRIDPIFADGNPVIFSSRLHQYIFKCLTDTGQIRAQQTTITSIPNDEKGFYALFSIEDVTDLTQTINDYRAVRDKMNDEINQRIQTEVELTKARIHAEEADKLKSRFLANMSHEIRTPLSSIVGFAELLRTKNVSIEKSQNYLDIIHQSSNVLLSLINDIIDISKIESSQMMIYENNFLLNEFFEALYSQYKNIIHQSRSKIEFTLKIPDKPVYFYGDEIRIGQIVTNLLQNAIKFTAHGSINFGFDVVNNKIQFHIIDTGIGISSENISFVFDRFRQGDDSISRNYGGTGLGLAICKGLVELMRGNIWIESVLNHGTSFFFNLPFKQADTDDSKVTNKTGYVDNIDWSAKKILIVDDVDLISDFLYEILKPSGAKLIFARRGKQAVENFMKEEKNSKIDLMLVDLQLEDMTGFELLEQIRQLRPDVKIIAQTAFSQYDYRIKCMRAGFTDFISKPIEPVILLNMIEKHLSY